MFGALHVRRIVPFALAAVLTLLLFPALLIVAQEPTPTAPQLAGTPVPWVTEAARTGARLASTPTPTSPFELLFTDSFDDENYTANFWTFGAGWEQASIGERGQVLQVSGSDAPVTFVHDTILDASIQARFLVSAGAVRFNLRQSEAGAYTVTLTADGIVMLTRGVDLLGMAPSTIAPNTWHTVRLSALGGDVRVAIDGTQAIAYQDNSPLPRGTISIAPADARSTIVVDNFELSIAAIDPVQAVSPTPASTSTPAPSPTVTLAFGAIPDSRLDTESQPMQAMMSYVAETYIDSGDTTTLRQVVQDINSGILPSPHLVHLANGDYVLDDTLLLAEDIILDGGGVTVFRSVEPLDNRPLLRIAAGTTELHNVVLRDARSTVYGNAIIVDGYSTLYVYDSQFINNGFAETEGAPPPAQPAGAGGIANHGTLFVERSTFTQNGAAGGGAIENFGYLTVTCSRFSENRAHYGGAILNAELAEASVEYSAFEDNNEAVVYSGGDLYNLNASVDVVAQHNWWGDDGDPDVSPVDRFDTSSPEQSDPTINSTLCGQGFPTPVPTPTITPTPTPTPSPSPSPSPTPTSSPTPSFTDIRFNDEDVELQGVMFWVIFQESIADSSDSGSAVDSDYAVRYTEFLFEPDYCVAGANPPSDNAEEAIIIGDPVYENGGYWRYIKHCPADHRLMYARTMMNGFLNYERNEAPLFNYATTNNYRATNFTSNTLWQISPCESNAAGPSYAVALRNGSGAQWLYHYMGCVATNPGVNPNSVTAQRVRRAYQRTILPEIENAILNFEDLSAGDPTNGAFSNLDANYGQDRSILTCVGGCYPTGSGTLVYTYLSGDATPNFRFAKTPESISFIDDVMTAYNLHIQQQVMFYDSRYSSVLQPVLRREFDRTSGVLIGYIWTTRVYQRAQDMVHWPR